MYCNINYKLVKTFLEQRSKLKFEGVIKPDFLKYMIPNDMRVLHLI